MSHQHTGGNRQGVVALSAVVLTKNEQHNLARCLESLSWVDEVVVVDDGSTDQTCTIAAEHGARVVHHRFQSFADQRNWALDEADLRNVWVLMLDADEVCTEGFGAEVSRQLSDAGSDVVAFRTCRKTMLNGVWLKWSDGFPVWIMRIVKRGKAKFIDSGHGEVPIPEVMGEMSVIQQPFLHYPFSRGMDDWWLRHVRYAGREASRERENIQEASFRDLVSSDASRRRSGLRALARRLPLRGPIRFLYQYVMRGGFLDGAEGLRFCRMMACYETMISIRKSDSPNETAT